MRSPVFTVVGAGATFAACVVLGTYLGWLAGDRTGHPALVAAGIFAGMLAGGALVVAMLMRVKF